jgi:hypothetical protein
VAGWGISRLTKLWLLIPVVLACTLLFPPLGLMASGGGALYAHRTGHLVLRNVFVACFIVVVVLTAVFQNQSNL